ncbi:UNVERIFIED_CONTAM: hypothetical protein Sindi_2269100 [Sesamum indicum]
MSRAYFLVLLLGALLATSAIANDKFDDEQELHKRKPHHPPRHAPAPTPKPSSPHPHVSDNDVEFDEEINEIELKPKCDNIHINMHQHQQQRQWHHIRKYRIDVEEFNQIKAQTQAISPAFKCTSTVAKAQEATPF